MFTLAGSVGVAPAARSASPPCSQPAAPAWIDYGDKWVPFRRLLFRPGLTVALAHDAPAAEARAGGAQLAFWAMSLKRAVGTPARPANPRTIPAATARLLADAVRVTGCSTPMIGLNELFGAQRPTPWHLRNARYRANVLALVQRLAGSGAQPQLFISQSGATAGTAGRWWREVAQSATIVRELYLPAPWLHSFGPGGASVYMRFELRRAVRNLTTIGIPSSRIGIALGFQSGRGGRMGLAAAPWFEIVKREALATLASCPASSPWPRCGRGAGQPSRATAPTPTRGAPPVSFFGRGKPTSATRRQRQALPSTARSPSRPRAAAA